MEVSKDTYAPWLNPDVPKYMLTSKLLIDIDGKIWEVPTGYVFDGASLPRPLWRIWKPTDPDTWIASCFHDRCYSHLYPYVTKKWADDVFREIMLVEGAGRLKAWTFHKAVRVGGRGGWHNPPLSK